jgi:hypothetical protein
MAFGMGVPWGLFDDEKYANISKNYRFSLLMFPHQFGSMIY